jgi:PAS domain S-box-containing protein
VAYAIAAAILVLLLLVLFGGSTPAAGSGASGPREGIVRIVLLALAVAMAVSCGRTALRAPGYNRWVWTCFTASGLCWSVAQGLTVGSPAAELMSPSPATVILLLGLVPAAVALVSIPPQRQGRAERLRLWVGVGIVVASVVLFCRSLILFLPRPAVPDSTPALVLLFVYPFSYVVTASLAWIVLLRVGTKGRLPLFHVTAGLVVYSWAHVYFSYHRGLGGGLDFEALSVGTACCYLAFILAALSPNAADPRQPPTNRARGRYVGLHSFIVYIPVMTSTVTVCALPRTGDPWVIATGLLVLALFGVRQMLFSMDNSRLRDDLESRLEDLVRSTANLRRLGLQTDRIVQSVVDGVIGVDARGVITFANTAAADILGYTHQDLLGVQEHVVFQGRPTIGQERPEDSSIVRTAMATGVASVSAAKFFVAADGRVFPAELAVGPIVEDDEITGAVVVFRDVSERRKIERMKNEFVSVVSHELRTPLTSIRGSLGLLAGGAGGLLTPTADRMVTVALESSERLTRLINDMLDIERIESGTMPVQLVDCQPRELMDKAVDTIRGLLGNHRIVVRAADDLSAVRADPDRIVQALTNLVGNAIKFSPPLTTIELSAVAVDRQVEFAVADQGRGIPADKLDSVFERFQQVDSSDSREKGGTGLGLAISRTIVRRHGGELQVTSKLGVGSTFRFRLPAVVQASAGPRHEPEPAEIVGLPRVHPDVKTRRLAR